MTYQIVRKNRTAEGYIVAGRAFKSVKAISAFYNVYVKTLYYRLRAGYSPEIAAGLEPMPRRVCVGGRATPLIVAGKEYRSQAAACKAHGVCRFVFHGRIRSGWTIEQGLNLAPPPSRMRNRPQQKFRVMNRVFHSFAAACDFYNVSPKAVNTRLGRGWTKKEAFGIEPHVKRRKRVRVPKGHAYFMADGYPYYYETVKS